MYNIFSWLAHNILVTYSYTYSYNKTWYYLHAQSVLLISVGSASEEYPLTVGGFTGVGIAIVEIQHSR